MLPSRPKHLPHPAAAVVHASRTAHPTHALHVLAHGAVVSPRASVLKRTLKMFAQDSSIKNELMSRAQSG